MKAAVTARYGSPDVAEILDVPSPSPGDDDLLVKVCASTVNRTDCGYRAASPFFIRIFSGLRRPKAPVLGTEFAGVVERVGANVSSFDAGDRVFGYCEGTFGAHAELMTIPADAAVAHIPAGLSFEEIAPATEGWHYALANIRAAKIESGQDVLVYGATGAIGSAAVQILASVGVNVTAVCTTEHIELVADLGAHRVIDRTTEEFTQGGSTYDAIFDAVGKSTFGRCRGSLRPGGVYLSTDLGPWAQNPFLMLATRMLGRNRKRVMMVPPGDLSDVATKAKEMIEAGQFRPVIDRTYSLDEIADAYRYVESGQKIGNVVIAIAQCD